MANDEHVGASYLKLIASLWQVDTSETRWIDGGFDWTPGSHLVRVRAFRHPHDDNGEGQNRWRLTIETDVLHSPPISRAQFVSTLCEMSRLITSTYALVYPPEEVWKEFLSEQSPVLSMFSSVYVSPDTAGWLPRFFGQVALMQPINAEIYTGHLLQKLGGQPAVSQSGKKSPPDEVLQVAKLIYEPEGRKPSRWRETNEFVEFASHYARSDTCFGMGDRSGMTLETPFGSDSALIRLRSDEAHPQLGNGLLVTVQLPFSLPKNVAQSEAAFLNFWEAKSWTDFPQLGCWHTVETGEGHGRLAHTAFIPNALYNRGLATNMAFWSIARVRWVRKHRWPDLQDLRMVDILEKRFGK